MNILGISCFYHDSAACLLKDADIASAAQEERFSRKKHDPGFPINSIKCCLETGGIGIKDLDFVGFYDNGAINVLRIKYLLKKIGYRKNIFVFPRRESYLASAFYPSYFKEAAIFINDTGKIGVTFGKGNNEYIKPLRNSSFNYSLGKAYSLVTDYLGFKPNSDEYKVMGLAAYGKPKYKINLSLLKNKKILQGLFGIPKRLANSELNQAHMDIASSVQLAIQEEALIIAEYLHKISDSNNLCLSGQVALNCLVNTAILKQGLFKDLWIQPAATDAGCAIAAAFLIWHKKLGQKRIINDGSDKMKNCFLGASFSDEYIESFLKNNGILYKKIERAEIARVTADLIASGKVVGWVQGRFEFGPRALGARSILADSRKASLHDRLNLKVKFRESFRPMAPTVLADKTEEYFDTVKKSPYMLFVANVKEARQKEIPAVTHIDNSSRIQTIEREAFALFYDTIDEFYKTTGCPVILNTSFNSKDRPIVLGPEDAYSCFKDTDMDCLVMGSFLVNKKD